MAVFRISADWRRRVVAIVATACLAAGSSRGQVTAARTEAEVPADRLAVTKKLQAPTRFDFDAVPLREFVAKLAEESGLDIRLDEDELRKAGISLNLHITSRLLEAPLHAALAATLPKYGLNHEIDAQGLRILPKRPGAAPAAAVPGQPRAVPAPVKAVQRMVLVEDLPIDDLRSMEQEVAKLAPLAAHLNDNRNGGRRLYLGTRHGLVLEVVSSPPPDVDRSREGDLVEEVAPPPPPPEKPRVGFTSETFKNWIVGREGDFDELQPHLEEVLETKIGFVDRACNLSDAQKQKLLLAGRADIRGTITRAEELRQEFEQTRHDIAKAFRVLEAAIPLRRVLSSGLLAESSLFDKILKPTLTADQAAAYDRQRQSSKTGAAPVNIKSEGKATQSGF